MGWPPKAGEALPRAAEAWCVEEKWTGWILAEGTRGEHGPEWRRVFRVEREEWPRAWEALAAAVIDVPIVTVRVKGESEVTCGVSIELTVGERTAGVVSAWHYPGEGAAPRLVTAYPRPYNRGHGSSA